MHSWQCKPQNQFFSLSNSSFNLLLDQDKHKYSKVKHKRRQNDLFIEVRVSTQTLRLLWGSHEQPLNVKAIVRCLPTNFPILLVWSLSFLEARLNPSQTFLWLLTTLEAHQMMPSHPEGLIFKTNKCFTKLLTNHKCSRFWLPLFWSANYSLLTQHLGIKRIKQSHLEWDEESSHKD